MTSKVKKQITNKLKPRPPVVVVLGHVDHGKTSILDYIRKTKVAEKETGGITQHVGAYEVEYQGKKITFIDTPGHEAFSAIRSRGAKVADIAILVIAAEEGIRPQTKEAIEHIKKSGIPMIVALNKVDKPEAQPEKVKGQLTKEEVVVESLGGEVPSVNVSAKTGQGIDELLELINLVAEMEDLRSDLQKPISGVVIESYLDSQRGPTATLLIKEGILRLGDLIATSTTFGKIKIMEDFQGMAMEEVSISQPVLVVGLNEPPEVGDKFVKTSSFEEAESRIEQKQRKGTKSSEILELGPEQKVLNLIVKTDVRGSIEPIRESLDAIPQEEVVLRIVKEEAGSISDSDVKLAEAAKAVILGFRTQITPIALSLAEQKRIKIMTFDVIYELIQAVRGFMTSLLRPEIVRQDIGKVKILAIFRKEKSKMIVGGKVISGEVKKGVKIDVLRDEEKIAEGRLVQLQRNKKDVEEVTKGGECGILYEGEPKIEEGDVLVMYIEERKRREL